MLTQKLLGVKVGNNKFTSDGHAIASHGSEELITQEVHSFTIANTKQWEPKPKQNTYLWQLMTYNSKLWNLQINIAGIIFCNPTLQRQRINDITETKNYATMHKTSTWKEAPQQQEDTQHDVVRKQLKELIICQIWKKMKNIKTI